LNLQKDILATLAYFDLFDYPLTHTEIFQFLQKQSISEEVNYELLQLVYNNQVFKADEFYSLQNDYSLIKRRRSGNAKARDLLGTAQKVAGLISTFPFVRGVAVSGSLSKNFADENSDIDFFIIMAPNRLWLGRTLLHIFKKLTFLVKRQDWFCMNYFIDEAELQIKEKNIYTATEVATLMPLRGIDSFQRFYTANKWYRYFLPNHSMRVAYMEDVKKPFLKKLVEFVFNNPFGNLLDYLLMKLTAYRWRRKTQRKKMNKRGVVMGMDGSKHYAKPNPENFQKRLVELYNKRVQNLFGNYQGEVKSIY
jgi:hypothetical protein